MGGIGRPGFVIGGTGTSEGDRWLGGVLRLCRSIRRILHGGGRRRVCDTEGVAGRLGLVISRDGCDRDIIKAWRSAFDPGISRIGAPLPDPLERLVSFAGDHPRAAGAMLPALDGINGLLEGPGAGMKGAARLAARHFLMAPIAAEGSLASPAEIGDDLESDSMILSAAIMGTRPIPAPDHRMRCISSPTPALCDPWALAAALADDPDPVLLLAGQSLRLGGECAMAVNDLPFALLAAMPDDGRPIGERAAEAAKTAVSLDMESTAFARPAAGGAIYAMPFITADAWDAMGAAGDAARREIAGILSSADAACMEKGTTLEPRRVSWAARLMTGLWIGCDHGAAAPGCREWLENALIPDGGGGKGMIMPGPDDAESMAVRAVIGKDGPLLSAAVILRHFMATVGYGLWYGDQSRWDHARLKDAEGFIDAVAGHAGLPVGFTVASVDAVIDG